MMNKKYNVIYADPPWDYGRRKTGRNGVGAAAAHYNTVKIDDLKLMPVQHIIQEQAILFMWVTVPLMPEGLDLLKAWGFRYKTMITWEKTGVLGMGNWLRVQTEHILIGVRGAPKPFCHQEKNIYKHPICKHSAKPHFFREKIMELSGKSLVDPVRLEMFARSRKGMFSDYEYEGWDVYGNQVNNSIILPQTIQL